MMIDQLFLLFIIIIIEPSGSLRFFIFVAKFFLNIPAMKDRINISIKPTKQPAIVKFQADAFIVHGESYEFGNIDQAKPSPLAQELFYLPFVKTIYLAQNFIAIEKFDIVAWEDVQNEVAQSIENYLNSGKPVVTEEAPKSKTPVTVYAESTPNPETVKFVANRSLVTRRFEYTSSSAAKEAPLVAALFELGYVKEVFLSQNYISITKIASESWDAIMHPVKDFIAEYLLNGGQILTDAALKEGQNDGSEQNQQPQNNPKTDQEKEIVAILEEFVTPAVAGDGGYIAFDSFDPESKTLRVLLQGACSGCPSSTVTLKNGIQTMLKEMTQGRVAIVEAING